MEHTPPPFFNQGPSARFRLLIFATLAITMLVVDSRLSLLQHVRNTLAVAMHPLQRAALLPRDTAQSIQQYFSSLHSAQAEIRQLQQNLLQVGQQAQRAQDLNQENIELRRLLEVRAQTATPSLAAQILYETHDPFTRKLILDKGSYHKVQAGQPVIDYKGVIGQITRVFAQTAELTLLTDRDQAIPVQIVRNGLRSVAYGAQVPGLLDLRFMAGNADVQVGDTLVTSGIDGLYPSGLPVARISKVERSAAQSFARIFCTPIAGIQNNRHVLILLVKNEFPPPPRGIDAEPRGRGRVPPPKPSVENTATDTPEPATPLPISPPAATPATKAPPAAANPGTAINAPARQAEPMPQATPSNPPAPPRSP